MMHGRGKSSPVIVARKPANKADPETVSAAESVERRAGAKGNADQPATNGTQGRARVAATDDILFRNNSTGDTWFEAMSNGALAGWQQVGSSDTHYAVVAVGDYFGNGTDDIVPRQFDR